MIRTVLAAIHFAGRIAAALSSYRGIAHGVAIAVALGLGFWGWTIRVPPADAAGWFSNLFRTVQLVTLNFPTSLKSGIPWQLHVARLAVPIVAALATFNILVGALTRPVRLALLPRSRDHVIVCGGEKLTRSALGSLVARGRQIVVVGQSLTPARRDTLEGMGLTVAEADPAEPRTFALLNVAGASALVIAGDSDVTNLNQAMLAIDGLANRPAAMPPLILAVQVNSEKLAAELDLALDGIARRVGVRYYRLCPDREGLRIELKRFAPIFLKQDREQPTHVLVFGLVGDWQQSLAQLIAAGQDHPHHRPLLTLVLDDAEMRDFTAWRRAQPELDLVAAFAVLPREALVNPGAASEWGNAHGPPQLGVVLRPDADAIAGALTLRRPGHWLGLEHAPLLVRLSQEDQLLDRLGAHRLDADRLADLVAFGGLVRVESIERILDRKGDEMAIALHAAYRDAARSLPPGSPESLAEWDALRENLRDVNRAAADHAPILFAAGGLRLTAATAVPAALDDRDLDDLARIEHRRWIANRIERGWRYAPTRDNSRRLHPALVPFETLPPEEIEKDRHMVRMLAGLLAAHGWTLTRSDRPVRPEFRDGR